MARSCSGPEPTWAVDSRTSDDALAVAPDCARPAHVFDQRAIADDAPPDTGHEAARGVQVRTGGRNVLMRDFSSDPDRQANIAFALIVLGIIFVGGLTIWLFYGAQF
jgi:hypothetical protein